MRSSTADHIPYRAKKTGYDKYEKSPGIVRNTGELQPWGEGNEKQESPGETGRVGKCVTVRFEFQNNQKQFHVHILVLTLPPRTGY